jgi:glycosyltransferase involved in cell wall biosynthesis
MRIVLVIASLTSGGAERVMTTLANHWASRGRDVALLTLDDGSDPPFYSLHPGVVHRPLGDAGGRVPGGLGRGVRRVAALRDRIAEERPNAVISFIDQTNVLTLLATRGFGCPVIVSERVDPHLHRIATRWEVLRNVLYPTASSLVVQTGTARDYFSPRIQSRARVIPNPVLEPADRSRDDGHRQAGHTIVAMGRLTRQKGYDLLIDAFGRLASRFPDWRLCIFGEGPEREALERQRDGLGLGERVRLPGTTRRPLDKMRAGDLFVLPSRFEGFPNVLGEAMACGMPVIACDCPSGPSQLIRNEVDGLLVPPERVDLLSPALERLMARPEERARLAAHAPAVLTRYGLQRVAALWEDCLSPNGY